MVSRYRDHIGILQVSNRGVPEYFHKLMEVTVQTEATPAVYHKVDIAHARHGQGKMDVSHGVGVPRKSRRESSLGPKWLRIQGKTYLLHYF